MKSERAAAVLALGLALTTRAEVARAQTEPEAENGAEAAPPPECLESFGAAQRLRREGRLRASAIELARCGAASCPAAIVAKCVGWLSEVRAALPSLVVAVRASPGGVDLEATVRVDGEALPPTSGRTIELDPGPHEIVAEREGRVVRQTVVVREGEKLRSIELLFPEPHPVAPPPPAPEPPAERPISPLVFIGFGLAGVATGIGIGTGVAALGEASALEDACGGTRCDESQRDDYEGGVTLANVSTGAFVLAAVGAVLGGVGVAMTVIESPRASARVAPGGAVVRGSF